MQNINKVSSIYFPGKFLVSFQSTTPHTYASFDNDHVAVQASDIEGVQAALQSVLNETAARLLRPKSKDLASLQSPLSTISGIPWLPLNSNIFSGEQFSYPESQISQANSPNGFHPIVLLIQCQRSDYCCGCGSHINVAGHFATIELAFLHNLSLNDISS